MKGVSAVIAVVLILMITVALAAMAYVWFTGVFTTISEGAGESATKAGRDIATSFSIGAASMDAIQTLTNQNNLTVYVTNTGTVNMNKANVNVFVDNKLAENTVAPSGDLVPGLTATYRLWNKTGKGDIGANMKCGSAVKVAYGSLEQSTTIAC